MCRIAAQAELSVIFELFGLSTMKVITNVLNTKRKRVQHLTSNAKALAHLLRALSGP